MRLIDADAFDERVRVAGGMSEEELTDDFKDGVLTVLEMLKTQPTVQPERKKGKWIPMQVSSGRDSWKCSECGRRARGKIENLPYCHCGADMRGGQHENHIRA